MMNPRRLPPLLLSVTLALAGLLSLAGLATAQPVELYHIAASMTGGAEYTENIGSGGGLACTWTATTIDCSGTFDQSQFSTGYAGLGGLTFNVPADIDPTADLVGFYFDAIYTKSANREWYLATGSNTNQSYRNDTAGTYTERLCGLFNDRLPLPDSDGSLFAEAGIQCDRFTGSGSIGGATIANWLDHDAYFGARSYGQNIWSMAIGNITFLSVVEPEPDTQEPGTSPGGGGASCVFTLTLTNTAGLSSTLPISGTTPITPTNPITDTDPLTITLVYTRNVNLVTNSSLESGGGDTGGPLDWDQVEGGAFRAYDWSDYWRAGAGATGGRYIQSGYPFNLYQDVSLYGPQHPYAAGFAAACDGATCSDSFALMWSPLIMPGIDPPVTTHGAPSSEGWTVYSGTKASAAGVAIIMIRSSGGGSARLDDIFVYPIDEATGGPLCLPEFYEPPGAADGLPPGEWEGGPGIGIIEGGIQPIGGIPGPISGAGSTCYNCFAPASLGAEAVSYWIAWLGCVIRNMFSCSLRVWLMYVMNSVYGVFQVSYAFLQWVPAQAQATVTWGGGVGQQFINWIASDVVPGLAINIDITTDAGTNVWDAVVAVIEMINGVLSGTLALLATLVGVIADLIMALGNMILGLLNILVSFVTALRDAFAVEPYNFDFRQLGGPPQPIAPGPPNPPRPVDAAALAEAGSNDQKIIWLFAAAAVLIDQAVVGEYSYVFVIALAAIGFGVIIWTLNHWRELLSF